MTPYRLIPVLLLKHGLLVRSQRFAVHQAIGNPVSTIRRLMDWRADEIVLLDISDDDTHDLRRDDLHERSLGSTLVDIVRSVSRHCSMPLTVGGRIRSLEDMRERLQAGADKCAINTIALDDPELITSASRRFGAQCVVVNIDALRHEDGRLEVHSHGGTLPRAIDPAAWAAQVERLGAGEILLNSIDRDGSATGYDLGLTRAVCEAVSIPVIACGGAGAPADFVAVIQQGRADAAAAANYFHFTELSYPLAKRACVAVGVPMRLPALRGNWWRREPQYSVVSDAGVRSGRGSCCMAARAEYERTPPRISWCARCVYPSMSAAPMEYDEHGVCMGCRMDEVKRAITPEEWRRRRGLLRDVLEQYRATSQQAYDCVIPVSGGKDSYYQAHVIRREFGLRPLLVTYNANNYTPCGWRNVQRMAEVFDCDHLFITPGIPLLRKLNRLGLEVMGDMNWHAHVGITTAPVRAAVAHCTPLLIWGEHGYLDLCGQFSMHDFPEMTYRDRLEHFARGYEWNYFVGREGITADDMVVYQYPDDQALLDMNVRGIYLGNYLYWEANDHGRDVIRRYGFRVSREPFDRTYRTMSNLDDMHENGVHDYLKYVKFGYGRGTDHACKDIRAGLLSRARAIELVNRYDRVVPRDLSRWLAYTGMQRDDFFQVADGFRDRRVWSRTEGGWRRAMLADEANAAQQLSEVLR
jgi:imidazoleglycerol phosphate synthase cyclase subunit